MFVKDRGRNILSTFHRPLSIFLFLYREKAQFRFVSAAIHKWKLDSLNFLLLNYVALKHRASLCIQPYTSVPKSIRFYYQYLAP